jgi:hypothetical protein
VILFFEHTIYLACIGGRWQLGNREFCDKIVQLKEDGYLDKVLVMNGGCGSGNKGAMVCYDLCDRNVTEVWQLGATKPRDDPDGEPQASDFAITAKAIQLPGRTRSEWRPFGEMFWRVVAATLPRCRSHPLAAWVADMRGVRGLFGTQPTLFLSEFGNRPVPPDFNNGTVVETFFGEAAPLRSLDIWLETHDRGDFAADDLRGELTLKQCILLSGGRGRQAADEDAEADQEDEEASEMLRSLFEKVGQQPPDFSDEEDFARRAHRALGELSRADDEEIKVWIALRASLGREMRGTRDLAQGGVLLRGAANVTADDVRTAIEEVLGGR